MIDVRTLSEQERLQLLVNAIQDYAIYMLDPDGCIATWNPGAARFKGYRAEDVLGKNYEIFFTPGDRSADLPGKALEVAAREGRFETEGWRLRRDGSKFWCHVVLDAIRTEDGDLIGFAKITRDITEKKEAEGALHESEQRFRMLVQGVKDYAIYMLSPEGRITNWNPGAEHIKGYREDEVVGTHFSRFYTDADRQNGEPQRALQEALTKGKYEREAWRVRKDGSLFWAHVLLDPILDDDGRHIGFAKITRDITDKKKAAEELEEARSALVQSQKLQALGELTGGIAHDFNNLMTVIAGSADFLRKNRDLREEKKLSYLDGIIETAERATKLTSQLLTFGRRQPVQPKVLNLFRRLASAKELLGRTLGSKYTISVDVPDPTINVEVDPAQFEAAVVNAVVNARDAMPDGGSIVLAAKGEAASAADKTRLVRISISDTGTGMPRQVQEKAFDPFFTTKEVGKGTGLGLSQIHGFAAQAGGRAEIASVEGRGTTISILMPASEKRADELESEIATPAELLACRILLVEDNEQVRDFAKEMLHDAGCEVVIAKDGAAALEAIELEQVDLILSDIVLPGMSGVELANRVREQQPTLPIVLMTGYSEQVMSGAVSYPIISKPFTSTEIKAAIETALAKAA